MNSKITNILGIVLVFFGLLTLMLVHLKHHEDSNLESDHESEAELESFYHILVGFPISVLGAMLLILAERTEINK